MKMSLNEAWEKCLPMWDYVIKNLHDTNVFQSKRNWLAKTKETGIQADCYFCQYDLQENPGQEFDCGSCPAVLVDKEFNCHSSKHIYFEHPERFREELLRLNKIRLETK